MAFGQLVNLMERQSRLTTVRGSSDVGKEEQIRQGLFRLGGSERSSS